LKKKKEILMARSAEYKFMQQQGFNVNDEESTKKHFRSLLFQPIIVSLLIITGIVTQSHILFLVLGLLLWFNTLAPKLNPFERIYDATFGKAKGYAKLPPAPPPRRFMQGMAGTLMLLTSLAISSSWFIAAYVLEAFIVIAFSSLIFGKFCLGAYIYHLIKGKSSFANETCPWSI
jgi:hypothetical protein